ncbi:MAG TPA: DUF3592 domain-containing protein [Vicinamibacteria bacterium]|nr:DUF3592 domain-containing protein [Vicinamibacteria bacterium]
MSELSSKLGLVLIVTLLGSPGVGVLVAGVYKTKAQWDFLSRAASTRGRVVSVQHLYGNDESDFYGVTVEYSVPDGPPRRFTIETNAAASFPEGRAVEVAYRADRPGEGRIKDFGLLWRDNVLFCVVGFAWAGFAGFFLFAALWGGRK